MIETLEPVTRITEKHGKQRSELITVLQDVQAAYSYLPEESLEIVSRELDVPLSKVYGVATFFKAFAFEPRGRHVASVCLGTACHVRGGTPVAEEFERRLGIRTGETTLDGQFTLETVKCLGCCAIGPVVVMDGKYRGNVGMRDVTALIEECGGSPR